MTTKVLGIDLASRRWIDNGTALLEFEPSLWSSVQVNCIAWPSKANDRPDAGKMAAAIHEFAIENSISAVSLDGPQGWRELNAPERKGVGRWCEYLVRAQGKTGEQGKTYPQTQSGWISFCIEVFKQLQALPGVQIANDPDKVKIDPIENGYW